VLSSGHGRKNDDADALSVGIAALTSHALGTAETDAATRLCALSSSTAMTW
jgi:transposase